MFGVAIEVIPDLRSQPDPGHSQGASFLAAEAPPEMNLCAVTRYVTDTPLAIAWTGLELNGQVILEAGVGIEPARL